MQASNSQKYSSLQKSSSFSVSLQLQDLEKQTRHEIITEYYIRSKSNHFKEKFSDLPILLLSSRTFQHLILLEKYWFGNKNNKFTYSSTWLGKRGKENREIITKYFILKIKPKLALTENQLKSLQFGEHQQNTVQQIMQHFTFYLDICMYKHHVCMCE